MRDLLVIGLKFGLAIGLLSVAACDGGGARVERRTETDEGGPLKVVHSLQCPQTQGPLTRRGGPAADGLSCTYAGPRGAEVTLHLVTLGGGSAGEALEGFEQDLAAELPAAPSAAPGPTQAPSEPVTPAAPLSPEGTTAAEERVDVRMPGVTVSTEGEDAVVRLPGMSVDTSGGKTEVRIGGLEIRADEASDSVDITAEDGAGGEVLTVRAEGDATVVRTRAPGKSIRANFLITDDTGAERGPWRVVGYEARGPSGGPIVVATVKAKDEGHDDLFRAARALLSLNVGD